MLLSAKSDWILVEYGPYPELCKPAPLLRGTGLLEKPVERWDE